MPLVYLFIAIIVLQLLYELAILIIWPLLLGWLTYIVGNTYFIKANLARFKARFVELIDLDHFSGKFVFKPRSKVSKVDDPVSKEPETAAYIVAAVCYLYYTNEILLGRFSDIFSYLFVGVIAISSAAAGLYAAIYCTRKYLIVYLENNLVKLRILILNAQMAHLKDFSEEAEKNDRLRVFLQASPSVARSKLLTSIQTNLPVFILGDRSLQSLIEKQTAALRIENRKLNDLNGKYASLQGTYDFACRKANRVNNEAVFRYLDLIAKGIAALASLIDQSKLEEFSQQIDGAQEELKDLLENIERIGSGEDTSTGAEVEENNNDPYVVLCVRDDLSSDEIKKVYRGLANIYHPDKGRVRDHKKFQQIERAWAAICKARNIR